jgi:hypothetical protein
METDYSTKELPSKVWTVLEVFLQAGTVQTSFVRNTLI